MTQQHGNNITHNGLVIYHLDQKPLTAELETYALVSRYRAWCRDQGIENDGQDLLALLERYVEEEEPESEKLMPWVVKMLAADLISLDPATNQ